MKIRHGDTVVIISGKDKGKSGTVERVLKQDGRVIVTGINMRTRHIKKTAQEAGRKIRYEAAIAISKVMIVDPKTQKPSRVGYQVKDGKKIRISKTSGMEVVKAKPKVEKKAKTAGKKDDAATKKTDAAEDGPMSGDKKSPFWKRMKFGASAMESGETAQEVARDKDHSIPSQEVHVRKGSRGS